MSDTRKGLETILWAGADVLRSKMDANEYKNFLLSFIFYKYLSDTFLVKVYNLLEDCAPDSMQQAQKAYLSKLEGLSLPDSCATITKREMGS